VDSVRGHLIEEDECSNHPFFRCGKIFVFAHRDVTLTRDASYAAIDAFVALPDHLRVRAIYGISTRFR